MHVKTVEELLSSQPMEFEAVTGTISEIKERRTGGDEKSSWTVENFILKGISGNSIRCALWNQGELDPTWKGREVYIIAGKGKRDVQKLSTEFGKNQFANQLTIKIKNRAIFTTKDPRAEHSTPPPPKVQDPVQPATAATVQPQPQPQPPVQHQNPSPAPANQRPPEPPQKTPSNPRKDWSQADALFLAIGRAYVRAGMTAHFCLKKFKEMGIPFPDDGIQAMTTSIMIAFKDRGGMLHVPNCDPMDPQHSQQTTNPPTQPTQPEQGDGTDSEYKY